MMEKKKFSSYLASSHFKNGILKIDGLKKTVLSFLILFLISILYILTVKLPFIVEIGAWLGIMISLLGIYDVIFSRLKLVYDTNSRWLSIRRKTGGYIFRYEGSNEGRLDIKIVEVSSRNSIKQYSLMLVFSDYQHEIPFPLEVLSTNEMIAETKKKQWQKDLKL